MSDDIDPKAMEIAQDWVDNYGARLNLARAITALLRERDEEIAEIRACFEDHNAKWGQTILRAEAAEVEVERLKELTLTTFESRDAWIKLHDNAEAALTKKDEALRQARLDIHAITSRCVPLVDALAQHFRLPEYQALQIQIRDAERIAKEAIGE